jgi:DNA repair photolyase
LEAILEAAKDAGASHAGYLVLRLPLEIKALFIEWLETHFPERKDKVLNRIRDLRDGKLYDSTFGKRMTGQGVYADLLAKRFARTCRHLKLGPRAWHQANLKAFRRPLGSRSQPSLFDL